MDNKSYISKKTFRLILELSLLTIFVIATTVCIFGMGIEECPILYMVLSATALLLLVFTYEVITFIQRIERSFKIHVKDNPCVIKKLKEVR